MCGRFTIIDRCMASIANGFEYKPNYNADGGSFLPGQRMIRSGTR